MRVNPTETAITLTPTRTAPAERSSSSPTAAPAVAESSNYVQTSDLSRYLASAREAPEIRAELIRDVQTRLVTGELETRAAAADTAHAMLDDIS